MTRRHDVGKRIATLREIDEILTAMKNLSLVEVRRIEGFIEAQRAALAVIEDAAADFLLDYGETIRPGPSGNDVLCVIGSERGFCGDFNARVAEEAVRWHGGRPAPAAVLLVGERLVGAWGGEVTAAIPGASVADEVPQALQAMAEQLRRLLAEGDPLAPCALVVVHQAADGPSARRLLPIPEPAARARASPHPVLLNLTPASFFAELTDQFLYAALQSALYESLLRENQTRLDHMEQAIRKLQDDLDALGRRRNHLRQEEITEEIEVILLNALVTT
jgi:F-type H+-transporting ATPase subunit gamma